MPKSYTFTSVIAMLLIFAGLPTLLPGQAWAKLECPDDASALLTLEPLFTIAEGEKNDFTVDKDYLHRVSSVSLSSLWEESGFYEFPEDLGAAVDKAATLIAFGDLREVEARMDCILKLTQARYGVADERYAMILFTNAYVVQLRGRYDAAESMLQHCLSILDETMGPEHILKIRPLTLLGIGSQAQGAHGTAVTYYKQALDILEKYVGSTHKDLEPWRALLAEASRG